MPQPGLQRVQAATRDVISIQGHAEHQQDKPLDEWQLHFSKQFYNLFNRAGLTLNYEVQANLLKSTNAGAEEM